MFFFSLRNIYWDIWDILYAINENEYLADNILSIWALKIQNIKMGIQNNMTKFLIDVIFSSFV